MNWHPETDTERAQHVAKVLENHAKLAEEKKIKDEKPAAKKKLTKKQIRETFQK